MIQHVLQQGPVIAALLRAGMLARTEGAPPETPGPVLREEVAPRSRALVDDYVRWSGGVRDRSLPPLLFPQWGFPLLSRTLAGIPYDLKRVMNAGCTVERRAPLPDDEPLELEARLFSIDDNGKRAILTQELVTGTRSAPAALRVLVRAFVPLEKSTEKGKEKPRVPDDATPLADRRLRVAAGWEFALLTGDFNPVHWVAPWARAAGFPRPILHGFGTLAIGVAALDRVLFSGTSDGWATLEARFARPVVLPSTLVTFARPSDGGLWVGASAGGPAYLTGAYTRA